MILVVAVLCVVVSVPLLGGSLRRVVDLELHYKWVLALAMGVQILVINVFPDSLRHGDAVMAHLYTYWLAVAFLLLNRHVRGFLWLGLGTTLNLLPIAANGGVMPASMTALRIAGRLPTGAAFTNSTAVTHARFAFLGDVFPIPHAVPLSNVFSAGDVVLVIGTAVVLYAACGVRLRGELAGDDALGDDPQGDALAHRR